MTRDATAADSGPAPLASSSVLRPGIRTFKPRRSRIGDSAAAALREDDGLVIGFRDEPLDLSALFDGRPVVVEVGFGTGAATVALARAEPDVGVLAIDVHTPGVASLLTRLRAEHVGTVRVMEADALAVLESMVAPGALAGMRSFFPDPWPKARHHKRRLIQGPVVDLVAARLASGGWWHIATDWDDYVEEIEAAFAARPTWSGGRVDRPSWRPRTRYEIRALHEGRSVTDLVYTLTP